MVEWVREHRFRSLVIAGAVALFTWATIDTIIDQRAEDRRSRERRELEAEIEASRAANREPCRAEWRASRLQSVRGQFAFMEVCVSLGPDEVRASDYNYPGLPPGDECYFDDPRSVCYDPSFNDDDYYPEEYVPEPPERYDDYGIP